LAFPFQGIQGITLSKMPVLTHTLRNTSKLHFIRQARML